MVRIGEKVKFVVRVTSTSRAEDLYEVASDGVSGQAAGLGRCFQDLMATVQAETATPLKHHPVTEEKE